MSQIQRLELEAPKPGWFTNKDSMLESWFHMKQYGSQCKISYGTKKPKSLKQKRKLRLVKQSKKRNRK